MSTGKSTYRPHRLIARSAGLIGFATLCSRILGFIRDMVIARLFGVYIYAQAFVIAFRIPNLLRDLLGEGATNAVFVPLFSEYALKRTKEEFWELANAVLNLLLVSLAAITLLGIIFSPVIVRLIAPGFIASPEKLAATIRLNRIIFPYILLISLTAYSMGILNSLKHFALPAFAPCLLNISIIVFAIFFGEGIKGLGLGVLVGGVLQLAVQIPALYKKGFRLRLLHRGGAKFLTGFKHPALRTIGRLMLPRVMSSSIYQLNNFADSIFGSLAWIVGEGGVAVLYFSYRLIQFPLGVFSNSLSQALLPEFSTQVLEDNREGLKQTLSWGLRATGFVLLPASVGLMVLSAPLVSAIFAGGRFDAHSSSLTVSALFFYSIGLFAYGATKVVQSCFFALKDTVTPAKISALALLLNIILNYAFMFPLKIGGIALATSVSGVISFFMLIYILRKRIIGFEVKRIVASFMRILCASICMGGACFLVSRLGLNKYLNLCLALASGFISYVIFCFIFRVGEMRELWNWVVLKQGLARTYNED